MIMEIRWRLHAPDENVVFTMLRREVPDGAYEEITGAGITADGLSFTFRDAGCEPGVMYLYRVDIADDGGSRTLFETGPVSTPMIPLTLYQNYPNPFNPSTTIHYYLPQVGRVVLDVYDAAGRRIITLIDEEQAQGAHTIEWNGREACGAETASGIYFYRLVAGKEKISKKMVLLR